MKKAYITLVIIYFIMGVITYYKFDISYLLVGGVTPELVEIRGLTNAETDALNQAFKIRTAISNTFFITAMLVLITTFLVRRNSLFKNNGFTKPLFIITLLIIILLTLAKGSGFSGPAMLG